MKLNIPLVLKTVLEDYALPLGGDHGVVHWARVLESGLRLADETGANVEVVQLFAVLHDSRRQNEVTDPEHGPRAAEFAIELRGTVFDLDAVGTEVHATSLMFILSDASGRCWEERAIQQQGELHGCNATQIRREIHHHVGSCCWRTPEQPCPRQKAPRRGVPSLDRPRVVSDDHRRRSLHRHRRCR